MTINNFLYFKSYVVVILIFVLGACLSEKQSNTTWFKKGEFVIPASELYGKTVITRTDSFQIEKYSKNISISVDSLTYGKGKIQIDTLYITWKNNFAYTLRMKNPKTDLDKEPIFVQINKVSDSWYMFTAKIGRSNFKQKGTVYKAK
ncbi:MAG: hypothetical protein ACK5H1_00695 [Tenacibaculum sp.]